MGQWLSICLPMQGTLAQSLVPNDSTCLGATKHKYYKYWSLAALEPLLPNKRSRRNEKPAHCSRRGAPARQNQSKPMHGNENPAQSKIKQILKKTSLKDQSLNIASLFHFINWDRFCTWKGNFIYNLGKLSFFSVSPCETIHLRE